MSELSGRCMSRRRLHRAALAATALLTLTVCGCGGSPAVKPAPLVNFKPTAKASVVWRASVGKADAYIFTPAVYEGAVYAAGAKGTLARFDAARGKEVWRVDTKERLSGGVGADAGLVVVATKKGAVLAYDLKGKLAWNSYSHSAQVGSLSCSRDRDQGRGEPTCAPPPTRRLRHASPPAPPTGAAPAARRRPAPTAGPTPRHPKRR